MERPVRARLASKLVVAILVVGAAACGGEGAAPLSRAQYTKRAGEECAALERASNDLQRAQAQGATGSKVSDYLGSAADGVRALAQSLDELEPPQALAADAGKLSRALADYGDGLDSLAARIGPHDTFQTALGSNQRVVRRLNEIAARASGVVADLGVDGCQLSG